VAPKTYKSFHYKAKTTWSSARHGMLLAAGRPNIVVGSGGFWGSCVRVRGEE
jgi:hypothetical protein